MSRTPLQHEILVTMPFHLLHRMKEQQLITAHSVEMESLISQHKHQSHLLLKNFNKAKELLNAKLEEAEKRWVTLCV